jgi:hypothetical protein
VAHAIHALVMTPADARSLIAERSELRAFALPQGWAIVPLNAELIDMLAERGAKTVEDLVRSLSRRRTHFGGSGEQRAAVWRDGEAILGPTDWRGSDAINEALRLLGVRAGVSDEFDALELVRFRRYDAFANAPPL